MRKEFHGQTAALSSDSDLPFLGGQVEAPEVMRIDGQAQKDESMGMVLYP